MSDTLRIMVRTEEMREISLELRCIIGVAGSQVIDPIFLEPLVKEARDELQRVGYVPLSRHWDARSKKWVAKFRTLREAYVDEIDAWHLIRLSTRSPLYQFPYHGKGVNPFHLLKHNRQAVLDAQALLRDKEIVLEVVKGGDV